MPSFFLFYIYIFDSFIDILFFMKNLVGVDVLKTSDQFIQVLTVNQKKGGGMEYRVMLKIKKLYPEGIWEIRSGVGTPVLAERQCMTRCHEGTRVSGAKQ